MGIQSICLIGGGNMGRQIAMNAAIHGFKATVYDLSEDVREDVKKWADEYLKGRILKGRLTLDQVSIIKTLFRVESDLEKAVSGVDCVIEAIVEIEDIKRKVFRQLSDILPEDTIICTNSSGFGSSIFADDVKNPSRLCNMHFFNPALVMKCVEIVQGPHTSEETVQAVYEFCQNTSKAPVVMKKEIFGFIGNYIYAGMAERARWLVQNGYCSWRDIDIVMEEGLSQKMGLFRRNDLTGVKLTFDQMKATYERTGVKPDMYDIYEEMVAQGRHGRACGHGFYDYE